MQRVTRDTRPPVEGAAQLDAKIALIHKHFPPIIASLYARPRLGSDGVLEWWSELGGQPQPYHNLKDTQQAPLLEKYAQRQAALGQLADELQRQGESASAQQLRTLIGPPDLDNLYSLNGDPLVVRWGEPPAPVVPTPPPLAPAAALAPVLVKRRRWWPWFLLLGLLALLLALWWWRLELLRLVQAPRVQNYACRAPGDGQPPPQFVTILDTSGSMNLNINATAADEEWLFKQGQAVSKADPRKKALLASPTRLEVAKQALVDTIGQLHPDIDTRLITFNGCGSAPDRGLFGNAARPGLIDGINHLNADGGTPLAASLRKAAASVDGRDRDAVVVMFVDGEDNCGANVCTVAREVAADKPRLQVNVVSIGDSELSNCIAEATGGRVYSSKDAGGLAQGLKGATQEVAAAGGCE